MKLFDNIANLRDAVGNDDFQYEPWMVQELYKCAKDVIYFCENYFKIDIGEAEQVAWKDAMNKFEGVKWKRVGNTVTVTSKDNMNGDILEVLESSSPADIPIGKYKARNVGPGSYSFQVNTPLVKTEGKISYTDQFRGMWDFQKDFIRLMASEINVMAKWPRQVGKSTCARAFLMWYGLFRKNRKIVILANKEELAQEQLELIKTSYMELPFWMQMGVKIWNQKGIQFGNGSRLLARATSKNAVRGMSINKLYCDEFAFVDDHIAEEFIRSVMPTISSGKNRNMIITSTPRGMNHFYRMWFNAEAGKGTFKITHIPWNARPGRDEAWADKMRQDIGPIAFNQEYMCEFLGSDATLINSDYLTKLQKQSHDHPPLAIKFPEELKNAIRIYELPQNQNIVTRNDWLYVACLDAGMGMKADSTVLQIFLVKSNRNLHQVAVMSANDLNIREFCEKALPLLKSYNFPQLIIEANGIGDSALVLMRDVFAYDNLIHFDIRGRRLGVVPTVPNKFRAVTLLKAYVEKNLMKLYDERTINELMSFGRVGEKKWKGKNGSHDDHVTSLMWIPVYLSSPMFWGKYDEDMINKNVSLLELPNDQVVSGNIITEEQALILASTGSYGGEDVEVDISSFKEKMVGSYDGLIEDVEDDTQPPMLESIDDKYEKEKLDFSMDDSDDEDDGPVIPAQKSAPVPPPTKAVPKELTPPKKKGRPPKHSIEEARRIVIERLKKKR